MVWLPLILLAMTALFYHWYSRLSESLEAVMKELGKHKELTSDLAHEIEERLCRMSTTVDAQGKKIHSISTELNELTAIPGIKSQTVANTAVKEIVGRL